MIFKIEGQPQGKGRPKFTRDGHCFTPKATREYENLIAEEYKTAKGELLDGYIRVNIKAYYKIPKSTTKINRGKIEAGMLADFVVLGDNPVAVLPSAIKDIPVCATYLGGKKVYSA